MKFSRRLAKSRSGAHDIGSSPDCASGTDTAASVVSDSPPPLSPSLTVKQSLNCVSSFVAARRNPAPVIGLVGGIGSGKSFIAQAMKQKFHLEVVEGDAAGHEVLEEPQVKFEIREQFGDAVFKPDGSVDRRQMGRRVFGAAPEQQQARAALEAIVHPRIKQLLRTRIAEAQARPGVPAVILDAALLLEANWRDLCDTVLFLDTPFEARLDRVSRGRGWDVQELRSREASQWPLERKRKEADDVIDNGHGADVALADAERIVTRILEKP